ncbi:MAG: hypothetical protein LIO63_08630 [Akkermansia sp.]|nr:hypothetical protein [Akkermansia sp.]
MKRMVIPYPVLGLSLALSLDLLDSCSWFGQQKEPSEGKETGKAPSPQYIGTVDQVYPERNFALIRLIGPQQAPGTTLITHPLDGSGSRVGNLSVSGERLDGLRLVADIRGGTVMRGDVVYAYTPLQQPDARKQDVPEDRRVADQSDDDTPLSEEDDIQLSPEREPTISPQPVAPAAAPARSVPSSTHPSPSSPRKAPSYLDDIPDTIDGMY